MKNSDHKEHRTGYEFLLIFIFLAAGIVIGGYLTSRNYEKNYRVEVEQQLSAVADLKVKQLVQWRNERLGDGQIFYRNDVFSAIVKRYIQNRNDHDAKKEILTWAGQVQNAYNYDLMMLLDAQLNTILVFPENKEQVQLVIDQKNTEILMSGNIAFQDLYRNTQDQHVYLKILVPILEKRFPKRLIAVLALRISPEDNLYPIIKKWPTRSRTSETLIIRRDGNDVLFLNELRFQKNTALNLRIPLSETKTLSVQAVLGQKGVVEGVDYRGVPVIGYVCAVPNAPWFLVARMDIEEVFAPLRERLWLMIILVGALLLGAGASVGIVWRRQRNRFYREQYKSAEALRENEELLQSIIDHSTSLIYIVDTEGKFILLNRTLLSLLSMPREKLLGQTREIVLPKDIAEIHRKNDLDVLNSGSASIFEEVNMEQDGKHVYLTVKFPLYNVDKKIYAIGGMSTDITERKRVEEQLKVSEIRYRRLFETAQDAVLILDAETGVIEDANPFLANLLGYEVQEVVGKKLWDIGAFIDVAKCRFAFEELQKKEYIRYENMPLQTKAGKLVQVEFVSNVYLVDGQKVIQCNIRDLTERYRTEEALHESEDKFKYIFDYSIIGESITLPSGEMHVNKAFGDMFGYTQAELQNKKWQDITHPDDIDLTQREIDQLLSGQQESMRFSKRYIHKSGSIVWADVRSSIRRDKDGNPVYLMTMISDITDRYRMDEALRESERRLSEAHKMAQLGNWNWDIKTGSVEWSEEVFNIFQLDPKEYTPQIDSIMALSPWPEDNKRDKELIQKAMETHEKGDYEQRFLRPDKSIGYYYSTFQGKYDGEGNLVSIIGTVQDITKRKQAEEEILTLNVELEQRVFKRTSQLEEANKELEAFSYSVSHDLRAPLRHVSGYVELLGKQYQTDLPEKGRHYLDEITDSVRQMGVLIDDLLKFSRSGRVEMHESTLDMNQTVRQMSEQMRKDHPQRDIEWSIAQLPPVYCDDAMMRLVWENLLSNAVKFTGTREKSRIEIGVCDEGEEFIFFVRDNGVGFDMKYAQKLFGVFQRLHSSAEFEGTGIGLANVNRIVVRHGGRAWAEAELDKGATFYFSLPK